MNDRASTSSNARHCPHVGLLIDELEWKKNQMGQLVNRIVATYADQKGINHIEGLNLPNRERIYNILDLLFSILFPGYYGHAPVSRSNIHYQVGNMLHSVFEQLVEQIEKAYRYQCRLERCVDCSCRDKAVATTCNLLNVLPEIRNLLKEDIQAAYEGDPAADSFDDIILCYPAVEAIATHRLAHVLYNQDVPIIPRMMSERAHHRTGIDIHPGAQIGRCFFIDHGTGVVIGETTSIGNNVKIYQGVTLGALSFPKDERGKLLRRYKRHPTVADNVTIYAGATILGGQTVIGRNAVIGGNVWITSSVPAGAKVTLQSKDYCVRLPEGTPLFYTI